MKKVISANEIEFVRDGHQPPTFPLRRAAIGPSRTQVSPTIKKEELRIMKNFTAFAGLVSVSIALVVILPGCQTPVEVSGSYGVPGTNITGSLNIVTNAVSIGGGYQTGATNITGAVTVGK
jgi:hypothetical protein